MKRKDTKKSKTKQTTYKQTKNEQSKAKQPKIYLRANKCVAYDVCEAEGNMRKPQEDARSDEKV